MKYSIALERARLMRKNPTPAESFFWYRVRRKSLGGYKFYRQYIIEHADILGVKAFFIVDFYCHTKKLVVELDGEVHIDSKQRRYDVERTRVLNEMGYHVIRFKNSQVVNNWSGVADEVLSYLNAE